MLLNHVAPNAVAPYSIICGAMNVNDCKGIPSLGWFLITFGVVQLGMMAIGMMYKIPKKTAA